MEIRLRHTAPVKYRLICCDVHVCICWGYLCICWGYLWSFCVFVGSICEVFAQIYISFIFVDIHWRSIVDGKPIVSMSDIYVFSKLLLGLWRHLFSSLYYIYIYMALSQVKICRPPSRRIAPVFMKDAHSAESNEKSIFRFLQLLVSEVWSFEIQPVD